MKNIFKRISLNKINNRFFSSSLHLTPKQPKIHKFSCVDDNAKIHHSVEIGPFCTIVPNVELDRDTIIKSHVVLDGYTKIKSNCKIYHHGSIGTPSQDKKYSGGKTKLTIGENCIIRENTTINCGTEEEYGGNAEGTVIKNNVYITCGSRIGHDCVIGNNVTIISSGLSGHVKIDDMAVIGGRSGIIQHIHIGKLTMVGAQSLLVKDTLPYSLVQGSPAYLRGVNLVGLRRNNYSNKQIKFLLAAQKYIFPNKNIDYKKTFPLPYKEKIADRLKEALVFIDVGMVDHETTKLAREMIDILIKNDKVTKPLCKYE